MILTTHTLIGSLIRAINRYEAAKAMEAIDKAMNDAGMSPQKLLEEAKKAKREADNSAKALQTAIDKLMPSVPTSYQP